MYSQVWEKLSTVDLPTEPEHALKMVDTGTYAYITDTTILDYTVAIHCGKYTATGYSINRDGRAFAVGKGKPYAAEINYK